MIRKLRFGLLGLCLLLTATLLAVPAKRVKRTIRLADGSRREVVLRGDEHVHFYEDDSGQTYESVGRNLYRRADRKALYARWAERIQAHNERRRERGLRRGMGLDVGAPTASGRRKATWGAASNPVSGKKKGLVILVNFSDMQMKTAHTQDFFNGFFNEKGFSQDGMYGSVHDYFWENSYGQFDLTFDVVGPVTVSNRMAYYGKTNSNGNSVDTHPAEMVIEACLLADEAGVDFKQYDWDGNGEVEQVFVVYAGYGESQGASESTIWPHEWALSDAKAYGDGTGSLRLDGVKVDTYAVSCELRGAGGSSKADGIGTACHEFSHCMCIPDMYDTESGTNFGMNAWDLMDYGTYNGPDRQGECPCGYTSYERMYCGWLEPTELNEGCEVEGMPNLVQNAEAYIIYNQSNKNEYYLLENRQKVGFDSYLKGHGMLVVHVDFNSTAWNDNTVNNTASHQRMTIIPADNRCHKDNLQGDPWPGTAGKTALTDTSTPTATLYNNNIDGRKLMGKPIEQIAENTTDGTISFLFNGGVPLPTPEALFLSNVRPTSLTARWMAVEGATGYEVQLTQRTPSVAIQKGEVLLKEDFNGFTTSKITSTGTDVGNKLDDYLNVPGWTGAKVFCMSDGEVKLGSGSASGTITTPTLSSAKGKITIVVSGRRYAKEASTLDVKVGNTTIGSFSLAEDDQRRLFTAEVEGDFAVTVSTTTSARRAYVSQIEVYDGEWTLEDLAGISTASAKNVKIARSEKVKTMTEETTRTEHVFGSLMPGSTCEVQVRAIREAKRSEWSTPINVVLPLLGDVDGDGALTPNDVTTMADYLTGKLVMPDDISRFDMNGDGQITIQDLIELIHQLPE